MWDVHEPVRMTCSLRLHAQRPLVEFYIRLQDVIYDVHKCDMLVITGNMNAEVRDKNDHYATVIFTSIIIILIIFLLLRQLKVESCTIKEWHEREK